MCCVFKTVWICFPVEIPTFICYHWTRHHNLVLFIVPLSLAGTMDTRRMSQLGQSDAIAIELHRGNSIRDKCACLPSYHSLFVYNILCVVGWLLNPAFCVVLDLFWGNDFVMNWMRGIHWQCCCCHGNGSAPGKSLNFEVELFPGLIIATIMYRVLMRLNKSLVLG